MRLQPFITLEAGCIKNFFPCFAYLPKVRIPVEDILAQGIYNV